MALRERSLLTRTTSIVALRRWLDHRHWAEAGVGLVRYDVGTDLRVGLPTGRELFIGLGDSHELTRGDGSEAAVRFSVTSAANESTVFVDVTLGPWARF